MSRVTEEQKRKQAKERVLPYILAMRNRTNKKTAGLRRIATEEPKEVGTALGELAQLFTDIATIFTGLAGDASALKTNLDLDEAPKTASIRDRVAARRKYARTLRKVATDSPEELGAALSEIRNQLLDADEGIEAMAERFGLVLEEPIDEAETINAENEADGAADAADAARAAEPQAAEAPAPAAAAPSPDVDPNFVD